MNQAPFRPVFWITALTVVSAFGCTPIVQVKDVNSNVASYLADNFTLKNVSPDVVKKFSEARAPGPTTFREVTFKLQHSLRKFGATADSAVTYPEVTYRPLGSGLFQETRYLANDGVPVGRQLIVSFVGLISLKRQTVPMQGVVTNGSDVKAIEPFRFFAADYPPGARMTINAEMGAPSQIANFRKARLTCAVDKTIQASELHAKIKGPAVMLNCETYSENTVGTKSRVAYFPEYGVSISMSVTWSENTTEEKILDFTVL